MGRESRRRAERDQRSLEQLAEHRNDVTVYWKWSKNRNDGMAHAMFDRLGITTLCGQHMSIYGRANNHVKRCPDCERQIAQI